MIEAADPANKPKEWLWQNETLRRSPRMTSGVATSNAHASRSMAKVMAMPATTPAKKPQGIALDRVIIIGNYLRAGVRHKQRKIGILPVSDDGHPCPSNLRQAGSMLAESG